ncbi:MAG: SRPBCC domain-containing protein [Bacteroidetes bacterium]|nr:SRPBCC domain-containing protein [Bacteroidota bacterium]MDE2672886.1 SRPBCC domain-containing protein [Bacteroidota bacterium]
MLLDVASHLDAVQRSVVYIDRDRKAASEVILSRSYATTVKDLWDALTNGDRIPRWFLPITGELELGGQFQFEGNAGGAITACERLSYLEVTWEFGGHVSWVEARVSEDDGNRARLTLVHIAHLSEQWDEYGAGATGVGWEMGLLGLALHIDHPEEPRQDAATFHTTPHGKALLTGSSEAWGEASVRGGTDAQAARAAARRTTAFYTGDVVDED